MKSNAECVLHPISIVGFGLAISMAAAPAGANDTTLGNPGNASFSVGIAGGLAPDYEGSDEYGFVPLPSFEWRSNGFALQSSQLGLEADLIPSEAIQAGPIVRYDLGRGSDVGNRAVAKLSEVGGSLEFGAYVGTGLPLQVLGLNTESIATARLSIIQGAEGGHEGMLLDASLGVVSPITDDVTVIGSLATTYMSDNYAESYFGVSSAGSASSGLDRFSAQGGFKNVSASLVMIYELNESWSLTGIGSYSKLLGDAARSPVVRDSGSEDQFFAALGVGYKFY